MDTLHGVDDDGEHGGENHVRDAETEPEAQPNHHDGYKHDVRQGVEEGYVRIEREFNRAVATHEKSDRKPNGERQAEPGSEEFQTCKQWRNDRVSLKRQVVHGGYNRVGRRQDRSTHSIGAILPRCDDRNDDGEPYEPRRDAAGKEPSER